MTIHPHIQTAIDMLGCTLPEAENIISDVGCLIDWSEDTPEEIRMWLEAGRKTLIDHVVTK